MNQYLSSLVGPEEAESLLKRYTIRELVNHPRYLAECKGIGPKTLAAFEAGVSLAKMPAYIKLQIDSPASAVNYFIKHGLDRLDQEELWVMILNTKHHVMGHEVVYKGNVQTMVIRAAEVLRPVIVRNCIAFITGHNHPSGDPTPSPEDITTFRSIHEAGKAMGVDMVDSLIIGHDRWVSLKERGFFGA